jgi:hypothetical protein
MIKVELTNAYNGIIKKITDTQYNGVDQKAEIVHVYEIENDRTLSSYLKMINLIDDIFADLGLDSGSDHDPLALRFDFGWGDKYNPTLEEVNLKIKILRQKIKNLNNYKEVIERNPNVNSV